MVSLKSLHKFADSLVFYPEASPFHGEYNLVLSIFRDDDKDAIVENSPDFID